MKYIIEKRQAFLLIGIIFGVIGIGLTTLLVIRFGPRRPQTTISEDTLERFQDTQEIIPTQTPAPLASPTQFISTQTVESAPIPSPTPSPTPVWMTYDGIDFRDQEIEVLFTMKCEQAQVYMNPFLVSPYSPELVESGTFLFNLDFAIAWEHLGFYGLWIHSGQSNQLGDLPAYPLQLYLENNSQRLRRNPNNLIDHLQNCLVGSQMILRQGETLSTNEVVAAVRIPPSEVDEVSRHPMELVPYLAENYPSSGFDQMELPGLLFYFCGRQLSGEAINTNYDYWTQSRFIIGFMPIEDDGENISALVF